MIQEPIGTPYSIAISIRRLSRLLVALVAGLVIVHIGLQFVHFRLHPLPHGLMRLIDLDEENNIPSWYSWSALLVASALFFVIAAVKRREGDRDARTWLILAIGFLVMSLDEDASIHESLNTLADISGNQNFSWTQPAMVVVAVLGIAAVPFLFRLPPRFRWLFAASGIAYLSGAVGMEKVAHAWLRAREANTTDTLTYNMLTAVEEFLEMASIVALIWSMLVYLRTGGGGRRAPPAPAPGPTA